MKRPPYIYGYEAGEYEKVYTEFSFDTAVAVRDDAIRRLEAFKKHALDKLEERQKIIDELRKAERERMTKVLNERMESNPERFTGQRQYEDAL